MQNVPHAAVIGYVILAIGMVLGLWRVQTVAEDVASISEERHLEVCEVQEQLRDVLRQLVLESANRGGENEEVSDAERARRDRFIDRSFTLLDESTCPLLEPENRVTTPEDDE